jgi:membrane-associated phospholipid phosphatase
MDQSVRIAKITSIVLHPYVVLVPAIAITVVNSLDDTIERLVWTVYTLIPIFVFTLIYAKIRAIMTSPDKSEAKIRREQVRNDPAQLLIMTILFAVPSSLILYLLDGPRDVLWIMLSLGLTMLTVTLVNTYYRASFHLAMITSMFTSLGLLFGTIVFITIPLVITLGFSRYKLGEHTPSQIVTGFVIGSISTFVIFYWRSGWRLI